jgi:hypothetical protein
MFDILFTKTITTEPEGRPCVRNKNTLFSVLKRLYPSESKSGLSQKQLARNTKYT